MSSQQIDYAALAEQARQQAAPKSQGIDYAALAERARQGSSGNRIADSLSNATISPPQPGAAGFIDRLRGKVKGALSGGGRPDAAVELLGGPALGQLNFYHGAAIAPEHPIRGVNEMIRGTGQALALPLAVANPATIGYAAPGAVVQHGVQQGLTNIGVDPDLAEMAGNISMLAGAGIENKAPQVAKSVGVIAKPFGKLPIISKFIDTAQAIKEVPSQLKDVWSTATPEAKAALVEKMQPRHEVIANLHQQLTDALSKANALPPEGPTATFKDVPDLRVQPSQQAPKNLLDARKAAVQAAQRGNQGEFPVAATEPSPAPQQAPLKATPNASIYEEPIPEKTAQQIYAEKFLQKSQPKPTLLEQLKQWDQIRQIHAQLEDQIGKGQDEIQQWMAEHNQQSPGGKAATPKVSEATIMSEGESDIPRVPKSDSEIETLLMKSLKKYGFQHDPATGKMIKKQN